MIDGAHVIIYSTDAEADRAFLRDVLELPAVDAGGGWLLFALPPAEVGVHPTDGEGSHELYFMCDDIEATKGELEAKGVAFDGDIINAGFGRVATLVLPGGGRVGVYQPRHPRATS
jgi:catechol 2,3-dioxygenase-like lactoylglutathione lyase family enzyme